MTKQAWIIFGAIGGCMLVGTCCGVGVVFYFAAKKQVEQKIAEAIVPMTVEELASKFKSNPVGTIEDAKGKIIELTGYIREYSLTFNGENYVMLAARPEKKSDELRVQVFLDSSIQGALKDYPIGSAVTIRAAIMDQTTPIVRVTAISVVSSKSK